ncbi:LuxR C-terminal-related transcriptional regulator [Kordiimonas pumila]|uniref:LuxR C-terminal-related transcriptional regulator n=1 Tax=Kordiimonas pumila TaxID=2161677 RepID=A0ABV7D4C2_9PROT|nr:LuxR C-terminal-related transcriptional regulator [Kordiimonas pumila]
MITELIITKLSPPGNRSVRVKRPQLERLMRKDVLRRVTLISAGAGFGKTTLMSEAYQLLSSQGMATAWISLDAYDQEEGQFLRYLIEAFRKSGIIKGETAESLLQNKLENRFMAVLTALINELAGVEQSVALFLDDYHYADGAGTGRLMESFIGLAPENIHFVLASRVRPQLPLATLKVHDELLVLSEQDLRFSDAETTEFMKDKGGLEISEASLNRLIQSTEGWAAGLQLVSLAVRDKHLEETFLKQFSGRSRDVVDFLATNVFSNQPEPVRTFMLYTSVLDRFNAEIAEVLTGQLVGQETLEYLEDNNLFIVPLDQSRGWFRYHHLFRDFLLSQFGREHKSKIASLRLQASQWFAENGLIIDAVSLAHESGDFDYLADLVEKHAVNIIRRGHMPLVLDWVKKIPADFVQSRPIITIYEGYALFHMRRPIEAASASYRAEKNIEKAEKAGLFSERYLLRLKQEIKVINAGIAVAADDVMQAEKYASVPLEIDLDQGGFMHGAMKNILGYACISLNKFDVAKEALLEARVAHTRINSIYGIVYADCFSGISEMAQGHLQKAYEYFVHAETMAGDDNLPNSPAIAVSRLYQGMVLYEWGKVPEAARLLNENIGLVEECGQAEAPIVGYTLLARINRILGLSDKIYSPLIAAHKICDQEQLHRLHVLTEYEYAVQLIADGKIEEAISRSRLVGINVDIQEQDLGLQSWDRIKCVRYLTKARLLIALGKTDQAILLLQSLLGFAASVKRYRRLLEIMVLLVQAYALKGDTIAAQKMLTEALLHAAPEKYIRLFVDEGAVLKKLLLNWQKSAEDQQNNAPIPSLGSYVRVLISAFDAEDALLLQSAKTPPHKGPNSFFETAIILEPLSDRESEVLRLLSQGYSNQRIGLHLKIAENTVKWHIKNLFEKLDVKNRTSAVLTAQELNLI